MKSPFSGTSLPFIALATLLWVTAMATMMFLFQSPCSFYNNLLVFGGENRHQQQRILHDQRAHFNVQLFLDLQYVDESLALDFESRDVTNPNIIHFCEAVQAQVFGTIVMEAASAYNSTIIGEHSDDKEEHDDDHTGALHGCEVVATSRVYDPEAEDVFGAGYFSLQVHVSQKVIVESSNQTLYLEVVQSVVEKGFGVVSGGQKEFRNNLYGNEIFRSVISVRIRRGLTAPNPAPTARPTKRPTKRPTTKRPTKMPTTTPSSTPTKPPTTMRAPSNTPSNQHTKFPTIRPANHQTSSPTQRPTRIPSRQPTRKPTRRPTRRPSRIPTVSPTNHPSATPTFAPTWFPTWFPTDVPSTTPSVLPSPLPSSSPSVSPTRYPSALPSVNPSNVPTVVPRADVLFVPSDEGFFNNTAAVASILGASAVVIMMSCLLCFLCYRLKRKTRRYNFRSPTPLSQHHSHYIPNVVELGDDHQSLADTTLGDHSVRRPQKRGKRPPIQRSMESFDENSLYTTPFPIDDRPEQCAKILPIPMSPRQSSLSSDLNTPLSYEDRIVFTASDSLSEHSHDEGVEFPLGSEPQNSNEEGTLGITARPGTVDRSHPVDTDSSDAYYDEPDIKITRIEPLNPHPSVSDQHDDFTRIPSDLDVWSCDFEDFDRGSDFYRGEEHSKAPSLSSSASTRRINNLPPQSSSSSSSLLTIGKPISKSTANAEKPKATKVIGCTFKAIPPTQESSLKARYDKAKKLPPPNTVSFAKAIDTKTRKLPQISAIALRFRNETKPTEPTSETANGRTNAVTKTKPTSTFPEEESQTSKQTGISEASKDTKTGAPTIDCLSGGIVNSLKDGVTTIDSLGNGIVNTIKDGKPKIDRLSNGIVNTLKDGAPKIESIGNGIVSTLKDGAPKIESLGNGLVSSLTDIFDQMAIPKITPEGNESLHSETSNSKKLSRNAELKRTRARQVIVKSASDGSESLYSETSDSRNGSLSGSLKMTKAPQVVPKTVSDDDSGISAASPWLMEKIEDTLGPKSDHADLASMTSKSFKSRHTQTSNRTLGHQVRANGSEVSYGSRTVGHKSTANGSEVSYGSRSSYTRFSSPDVASIMSKVSASMSADILAEQRPEEISFPKSTRTALEEKKKRLEQQLADLDEKENKDAASSVTMSSVTWGSYSTLSARSRTNRDRRQVIVCVPPGKLGVILADQHDGKGTKITSIKSGSPVERTLKPGDRLVAVDEIAVVEMTCSQITSLIASRAEKERRFTVMTTVIKNKEEASKTI